MQTILMLELQMMPCHFTAGSCTYTNSQHLEMAHRVKCYRTDKDSRSNRVSYLQMINDHLQPEY